MRGSLIRRVLVLIAALALLAPALVRSSGVAIHAQAPVGDAAGNVQVQQLGPEVVAAGLSSEGTVLRQSDGLTVERVRVPASLRTEGVPATVFRVTLRGKFPPRDLRYVVLAGGRPVGYGIPSSSGRSVRTVTADASVLTEAVTANAGDRPQPSGAGNVATAQPVGAGRDPKPAAVGPYGVTRAVYNLGERVFQPAGLSGKVELIADVHFPTGLPDGPYPLVLFMHGNHYSCYKGNRAGYKWPCGGMKPLPNFKGYDYIAARLASYGYIVVSVSANGVNVLGNWVDDTGMRQRGEVIEKHIDLWNAWNSTGGAPFGDMFVGEVDMSRIGVMGHSRGGEGAVYSVIVDRERPVPYGIDAVLALAPVDFTRAVINDIPLAVVLPSCDGDVWDLQGVHFFDDARYLVPGDTTPKATVLAMQANHNFFNTVWSPGNGYPGAFDDGRWTSCRQRLTQPQQRHVGDVYVTNFFRRYIGGETDLDGMWTGASTPPIAPARTLVSYLAPDTADQRLDVDRFTDTGDLSTNELGGGVTTSELSMAAWCEDVGQIPCTPGDYSYYDVHLSWSWFVENAPGPGEGVFGWTGTDGVVRFELPGGQDVSGFDAFQFRATVNPAWVTWGIQYHDLVVMLEDGDGNSAEVVASDVGNEPLLFPKVRRGAHIMLNQLRFPLNLFDGVNLHDISSVEIRFSRTEPGVINITDVNFTAGAS